jgi:hypothetical protein
MTLQMQHSLAIDRAELGLLDRVQLSVPGLSADRS